MTRGRGGIGAEVSVNHSLDGAHLMLLEVSITS